MLKLSVLIIAILIISAVINLLMLYSVGGFYRLFVAPGIILHELSHAFACLVCGARVSDINMFRKDGGDVKHGKAKIPILGAIVISLAPFIAGAVAIYFMSKLIGLNPVNPYGFVSTPEGIYNWGKFAFANLDMSNPKTWIALYLISSVAVTMTPSLQDMKNAFISIIVFGGIVYLFYHYTSFRPNLNFLLTPQLFAVLSSTVAILLLVLFLSIIIFGIASVFKT